MSGSFIGLPIDTLNQIRDAYVACLVGIAAGQSYTISGRTLTRADLAEVRNTIQEVEYALARASGRLQQASVVSFNRRGAWRG